MAAAPPDRPRRSDTGLVRPYRPPPRDFRDSYLRLGQTKELREYHRTNDRCIIRWIEECGGDELRAARRAITGSIAKPMLRSTRARDYVQQRRARG